MNKREEAMMRCSVVGVLAALRCSALLQNKKRTTLDLLATYHKQHLALALARCHPLCYIHPRSHPNNTPTRHSNKFSIRYTVSSKKNHNQNPNHTVQRLSPSPESDLLPVA